MARIFFIIGSVLGGIAVATGAFSAHGLRNLVQPGDLGTWETAARYQMYHGLALLAVAFSIETWPAGAKLFITGGWFFVVGVLLFSGSLYTLVLTGIKQLGAITPIGGVLFVIGWILMILGLIRK